MTCWRCGRSGDHASFCSMPGGCSHCGWTPCRWWCEGPEFEYSMTPSAIRQRAIRARLPRCGMMRQPLAGVRLRSDVNDEIASENRAISRIEEAIDNYVPPRCEFCMATAQDWCSLCERPMCEDDSIAEGMCVECDAEVLS